MRKRKQEQQQWRRPASSSAGRPAGGVAFFLHIFYFLCRGLQWTANKCLGCYFYFHVEFLCRRLASSKAILCRFMPLAIFLCRELKKCLRQRLCRRAREKAFGKKTFTGRSWYRRPLSEAPTESGRQSLCRRQMGLCRRFWASGNARFSSGVFTLFKIRPNSVFLHFRFLVEQLVCFLICSSSF